MEAQVLAQLKEQNINQRNKMAKETKKQTGEKVAKAEEKLDEKATKKSENKVEEKSEDKNQKIKEGKKEKTKREFALVSASNIPISTKQSIAICKFIKGKSIADAVRDLDKVVNLKKAVPMKGEIPHRKGKRMMSGRFPAKASKNFVVLLESLAANATDIDNSIITEAIANIGKRPLGRFGRVRKKRTHIRIVAREKSKLKKEKKKTGEKNGRK